MNFEELLLFLKNNNIKFIVVGGVACALNGFIRATEDVDIIIEPSDANIKLLIDTLKTWGEGYSKELTIDDFSITPGAVRIIEDFPLDVFTLLNNKQYNNYIIHSRKTPNGIHYLRLKDLIETKQNTYREKDQIDILALKKILKS